MNYCKNCNLADCKRCGYFNSNDKDKKLFVINAYENYYLGDCGVESWSIKYVTEKEAHEIGAQLSRKLIDSNPWIIEKMEEELYEESLDSTKITAHLSLMRRIKDDDIAYDLYEITETNKTLEELENLLYECPEVFVRTYCKEVI